MTKEQWKKFIELEERLRAMSDWERLRLGPEEEFEWIIADLEALVR